MKPLLAATRAIIFSMLAAALAAAMNAASADNEPLALQVQIERLAADLAGELSRLCPPAQPGDQAAFDHCRQSLFQDSLLRRSLVPYALWGRVHKNTAMRVKDTNLTQFAPDVLAGMYLPLFMFNGRYTVEYDALENLFLVRLETAFRN